MNFYEIIKFHDFRIFENIFGYDEILLDINKLKNSVITLNQFVVNTDNEFKYKNKDNDPLNEAYLNYKINSSFKLKDLPIDYVTKYNELITDDIDNMYKLLKNKSILMINNEVWKLNEFKN